MSGARRPQDAPAHALHTREEGKAQAGTSEILQRARTRDAEEAFPFDLAMPITGYTGDQVEALRYRPVPYPGCCPAITKAGTVCGRTVVLGNGRCKSIGHGGENRPQDIAAMLATAKARAERKQRRAARRARKAAQAGRAADRAGRL